MIAMKIYKILLCFKVPNEKGALLDFRTKRQDIIYGVLAFNRQFRGEKVIKLINVYDSSIELLLKINKLCEVTAREITYFSKRLHHDRDWKSYSRDETKLFTATQFNEVTREFIDSFDSLPEISSDSTEKVINSSNAINHNMNLSDEDAINALKALINLQNIGSKETIEKRKDILVKIKNLLIQAI